MLKNPCSVILICPLRHLFIFTVNLLAIVVLSAGRCGLSRCITRYLLSMAVADLLVLITEVLLYRISRYYFPGSFLEITPVCSVHTVLLYAATDTSVWLTVAFTFDRFLAICCQKFKLHYCTEKVAAVVISTVSVLSCSRQIPRYFANEPKHVTDNIPWNCEVKASYYVLTAWIAFDWLDTILTPFLPFVVILLLNSLTIRHIVVASRVRKTFRENNRRLDRCDREMENRRKSIILLTAISGSFIVLWTPYVVQFLHYQIANCYDTAGPRDPIYIFQETAYMLQVLSCCTNTCIYTVIQAKFREEVKNLLKCPLGVINQLISS
ncbi:probable G-protein coupled receptor 139 [Scyliorhinus torazame]|uniref:probable G-protein coupled receptor 139 n=1 Tax=Scyliorhinus torazame TaxID=75743 RepID=UPI003B5B26E3